MDRMCEEGEEEEEKEEEKEGRSFRRERAVEQERHTNKPFKLRSLGTEHL